MAFRSTPRFLKWFLVSTFFILFFVTWVVNLRFASFSDQESTDIKRELTRQNIYNLFEAKGGKIRLSCYESCI